MIRQTSIDVYNQILDEGLLSKKRFEVYDYLYKSGPKTGAQISLAMRSYQQVSETVRNRLTELVKLGVVAELGIVTCPVTDRKVFLYDVTDKLPVDYERPMTSKERMKKASLLIGDYLDNRAGQDNLKEALNILGGIE